MRNRLGQSHWRSVLSVELRTWKWLLNWIVQIVLNIWLGLHSAKSESSTQNYALSHSKRHLDVHVHGYRGKSRFSERRKNVADSQYSLPSDECNFLNRQTVSSRVCRREIVKRLSSASKVVYASIDDLKSQAAHSQKAGLVISRATQVT